jgi:hypothetical protein
VSYAQLTAVPMTQRAANAFIAQHHRHHAPPRGDIFRVGVMAGEKIVGVVIVGRPSSRVLQGRDAICEITRLCVLPLDAGGARNAASFLEGRACKAAFAIGYRKVITYIRRDEKGMSVKAAGFRTVAEASGRSWDTPSRRRTDKTEIVDRQRLERDAA